MDDDFAGADDEDAIAQIPRLEAQIERLAHIAESCRKVILAAKVAIAAAALVLLVSMIGLVRVDALVPLAAIAAIIGGIAAAGSNARTLRETTANMRAAETRRAKLIAALPFSTVIDDRK
jgi:hypothetical protein